MKIIIIFLAAAITLGAYGQQINRISGKDHPELIPDSIAYRAVFMMHSHMANSSEVSQSERFHDLIRLSPSDHKVYDDVLLEFRQKITAVALEHDSHIDANPNEAVGLAAQESASSQQALLDAVSHARNRLHDSLSAEGLARLDRFVQSEKVRMTFGTRGQR